MKLMYSTMYIFSPSTVKKRSRVVTFLYVLVYLLFLDETQLAIVYT